jgi:Gpi18-like mannosyltransferase
MSAEGLIKEYWIYIIAVLLIGLFVILFFACVNPIEHTRLVYNLSDLNYSIIR